MFILFYLEYRFQRVDYNTNIHRHNDNLLLISRRMQTRHAALLAQQQTLERE